MTISRLSGNRVLIFLGTGDLRDYALDFSRMNASDSRSMSILSHLSRAACKDKGIPTAGKRLSVEALGMNDGCYLLVTVGAKGKRYRSRCATLWCDALLPLSERRDVPRLPLAPSPRRYRLRQSARL